MQEWCFEPCICNSNRLASAKDPIINGYKCSRKQQTQKCLHWKIPGIQMDSRFPCTYIRAVYHLWKVSHKIVEKLPPLLIVSDSRKTLSDLMESPFRCTWLVNGWRSYQILFYSKCLFAAKISLDYWYSGRTIAALQLICRKYNHHKSMQLSVSVLIERKWPRCLNTPNIRSGRSAQ